MTLVSQAEYARRLGVSSAAVSQWKSQKRLIMDGNKIDVEKSDANLKKYRLSGLPDIVKAPEIVKRGRPIVKQPPENVKQSAALNETPVRLTCDEILSRLEALDYTQTFDWSHDAMEARATRAAQCLGWRAIQSEKRDDGHWGGFQLRLENGGVAAGYGFELSIDDVLHECRDELAPLDPEDDYDVRLDLLHLLARPYHEFDVPR